MASSPTSAVPAGSPVCCAPLDHQKACAESFFKEHDGRRYCVVHYPVGNGAEDKSEVFRQEVQRKLQSGDFNFAGAQIPEFPQWRGWWGPIPGRTNFDDAEFHCYVEFLATEFAGGASFSGTIFHKDANFSRAVFGDKAVHDDLENRADFSHARFDGGVSFYKAIFHGVAQFWLSVFHENVDFSFSQFRGRVTFNNAQVHKSMLFYGSDRDKVFEPGSLLELDNARFESPECVLFHRVPLRPGWFVNTDPRKFEFTKPLWPDLLTLRWIPEDLKALTKVVVEERAELLAIACQRLATNSEENQRYGDASAFRYAAMDLHRRQKKLGGLFWRLEWWYWFASGYSERLVRSLAVLAGIWVLFALLYAQVGFVRWEPKIDNLVQARAASSAAWIQPLRLTEALGYSAAVMTLQKPEPRPSSLTAKNLVLLESLLGPVQAALLALAVRRRFMRI